MSRKKFMESLEEILKDVRPKELKRLHDFIAGWAMAVTSRKREWWRW